MATYVVKFQRDTRPVFQTERFDTLQEAHAYAAQNQQKLGADLVVITEEDDDGNEVRDHALLKI